MSERAYLAQQLPDGSFRCSYLHNGALDHVAPILQEHYNSPDRAQALLDLGKLSTLGAHLGPPPDADLNRHLTSPARDQYCYSWQREAGDRHNTAARVLPGMSALLEMVDNPYAVTQIDHLYLWSRDAWQYRAPGAGAFIPLPQALANQAQERRIAELFENRIRRQAYAQ